MKKILLLMGFCCTVSLVNAQAPQNSDRGFLDSHHNRLGTITDAHIYNTENKLVGLFSREGGTTTIMNGKNQAVGYIVGNDIAGNEFQNASHGTIGFTQFDRSTYILTVEDMSHKVLGYIKPGGIVENSSHSVIGYDVMTEPVWGAAYFFLTKF